MNRLIAVSLVSLSLSALGFSASYDSIDEPGASEIAEAIRSDQRSPTNKNISGSWGTNPYLRGAANHFSITEKDGKITGVWISSGCLIIKTYDIVGTREDQIVKINLIEKEEIKNTLTYFIVDFEGTISLSNKQEGEEYPITPYIERERIKKALKQRRSNQASHTMPASARPFHYDLKEINPNRLGTSTEAAIVWI